MRTKIAIILIILLAIAIGCQSKYTLRFFKIEEQAREELKAEECYYVENYRISSSSMTMNLAPGQGNLLIAKHSGINPQQKNLKVDFFSTEGSLNYWLYINLPTKLQKDSLAIDPNSVCWISGDYERADSLRQYRCRDGYLLIDSVKASRFFLTMSGKFFNITGDSLVFSGAMRPKKEKELYRF